MRFVFNERKAAQAAALLLKLAGGSMLYLKLIKLLYLADRESLLKIGRPITGDRYVSMDRGPVLSRVYNLIYEPSEKASVWFEYISKPEDYSVRLVRDDPESDEMSPYETHLLEAFYNRFGSMDQFDLANLTHQICPEWKDPKGSSIPISPEDILREASVSEQEIEQIREEADELWLIDNAGSVA